MMKRFFPALIAVTALYAAAADFVPGICFRFDDNQTPEIWEKLAEVFRKHNARFGMSVNLESNVPPSLAAKFRQLQQEGFEIMDHTPAHQVLLYRSGQKQIIDFNRNKPFVDHSDSHTLYLKYDLGASTFSPPFRLQVQEDGFVTASDAAARKNGWLRPSTLLKDESDAKCFYLMQISGRMRLVSIWSEKTAFPAPREILVRKVFPRFRPYPGSLEFLVERTFAACDRMKLNYPSVWIQPGGRIPLFDAQFMGNVLLKYGYVSAATVPDSAQKKFGEAHPERCRFAMEWGDFNLERQSLKEVKEKILKLQKEKRVAIGSSHCMPFKQGKGDEYIRLHDELLTWCAEKHIPVKLQSEWAKILYPVKPANRTFGERKLHVGKY